MINEPNEEALKELLSFASRISDLVPEDAEIYDEKGEVSSEKIVGILGEKYNLNDRYFKDLLLIKISALIQEYNIPTIQKISDLYDKLEALYKKYNDEISIPYYNKFEEIANKHNTFKSKMIEKIYIECCHKTVINDKKSLLNKKILNYFADKYLKNEKNIDEESKPYLEEAHAKKLLYLTEAKQIEEQICKIIETNDDGKYMTNPIEKLFETDGDSTHFFLGQFRETECAIVVLRLNYFYPNNVIKKNRLGKERHLPFPELLTIDFDRKDLETVFALNKRDNEIAKLKSPELYERLSKITGKTITSLTLDNLDEIKDIIEAEKLIIALKEQPWKLRALNEQVNTILQYEGVNLDQDNYSNSEVDTETHSIRR